MTVAALTLDTALGIGGLLAIVVSAVYAFRFRATLAASEANAKAWQGERDAEAAHRKRLETRVENAKLQIAELEGRVEELSRRPDLTVIQRLMENHEERAQERADRAQEREERMVAVLQEIAAGLRATSP